MINPIPHIALISTACGLLLAIAAQAGVAPRSKSEPPLIELPEQSLSKTIIDIGNQCDLSIIFPSQLLRYKQAPALTQEPCTIELLERLTLGAGLAIKVISTKAVAIVPTYSEKAAKATILPTYYEEITVQGQPLTGSRLAINSFNTSAPVDLISAPELANSGAQTLVEFLKFTPAVAGNSTSTTVSNGGNGTAKVTLRGLPEKNTLVLINGRRVAGDGLGASSVDLNSIAPSAVERIEIYTDGASAIYGSDAIAGVVNIVLKKSNEGTLVEQYYGISSRGDLATTTTNLLANLPLENGNLLVSASIYEQDGLFSRERDFSASADARDQGGVDLRSQAPPNALIAFDDQLLTLGSDANGNLFPGTSRDQFREFRDEDLYNYNEETSSTSPSERNNLYLSYEQALSEDISLFASAGYAQTEATITLAPIPLFTAQESTPVVVAADSLYNPFDEPIYAMARRLMELGNREQTDRTKSYRYNLELEGFADALHWNLYSFWSRSDSEEQRTGLADLAKVTRALGPADQCLGQAVDGCTPLNVFGPAGSIDAQQINYIATSETTRGVTDLRGLGLAMDGSGFALPAGRSEWVLGTEWRLEKTNLIASSGTGASSFVGGTGNNDIQGSRRVYELYSELHLPLLANLPGVESLDLELAARYSHYSDFGDNSTPKIGLKYHPTRDFLVRATLGEGFRAPTLDELHLEGFETQAFLQDPCAYEENAGLPGCLVQTDASRTQFLTVITGDTNLNPEKSVNTTFGVVYAPERTPGLRLAADWFYIEMSDIITTDAQMILYENAEGTNYQDLVVRDNQGNISVIYSPAVNLGKLDISGVDMNFMYLFDYQPWGTFEFSASAVYIDKYEGQSGNYPSFDYAGVYIDSASMGYGSLPEWKSSFGLEWTRNNFQLNYGINYIDSMLEQILRTGEIRTIDSWTTHNLQLNYQPTKHMRLTLGVDNLFDEPPPFVASTLTDNFDAFAYNPKQQYWYGKVGYNF